MSKPQQHKGGRASRRKGHGRGRVGVTASKANAVHKRQAQEWQTSSVEREERTGR